MNPLAIILAQDGGSQVTLNGQGALIMFLCVGLVLGLNVFCLLRILRGRRAPRPPDAGEGPDLR